jgi:hypothetical protein
MRELRCKISDSAHLLLRKRVIEAGFESNDALINQVIIEYVEAVEPVTTTRQAGKTSRHHAQSRRSRHHA